MFLLYRNNLKLKQVVNRECNIKPFTRHNHSAVSITTGIFFSFYQSCPKNSFLFCFGFKSKSLLQLLYFNSPSALEIKDLFHFVHISVFKHAASPPSASSKSAPGTTHSGGFWAAGFLCSHRQSGLSSCQARGSPHLGPNSKESLINKDRLYIVRSGQDPITVSNTTARVQIVRCVKIIY